MTKPLWYLLVLTIPFGIRTFISGPAEFSEYASIFLYASDIILFLFVLSVLPGLLNDVRARPWKGTLLVFLLFAAVSVVSCSLFVVSLAALLRLALLVGAAVGARKLLQNVSVFNTTLVLVALLALFQATVAIMQFTAQGPVGLGVLGESPISIADPGTAKITVEGARFIRAYGTMPDPNILAGFLLIGLGALAYLLLKADKGLYVDAFDKTRSLSVNFQKYLMNRLLYGRIVISAAMFIVSMGLIFTFSRSGWASAALAMVILLIPAFRQSMRAAGRFLALLLIMAGALYYFFSPLIIARTGLSASEPSVSYRVEYTKIGVEQLTSSPLIGVGIGSQVQEAIEKGRYASHGMTRAWESQPVHNLYLLIAVEIGVIGALSFIAFLAIVMWRLTRNKSFESGFALSLLVGLLFFGLFDHFLWDLQAGKMMLWVAIAIALASYENTPPEADQPLAEKKLRKYEIKMRP
ncbi:MAG: O-antigen ligase family protein [bacterium]|nr:O-antigen ligase family protein [bacterium]